MKLENEQKVCLKIIIIKMTKTIKLLKLLLKLKKKNKDYLKIKMTNTTHLLKVTNLVENRKYKHY